MKWQKKVFIVLHVTSVGLTYAMRGKERKPYTNQDVVAAGIAGVIGLALVLSI